MASIFIISEACRDVSEIEKVVDNFLHGRITYNRFMKFINDHDFEPQLLNDEYNEWAGDTLSEYDIKSNILKEKQAAKLFTDINKICRKYRKISFADENSEYKIENFTPKNILKFIDMIGLPTEKIRSKMENSKSYFYKNRIYQNFKDFERCMKDAYEINNVWKVDLDDCPEWFKDIRDSLYSREHPEVYEKEEPEEIERIKEDFKPDSEINKENVDEYADKLFREIINLKQKLSLPEINSINELAFARNIKGLEECLECLKKSKNVSLTSIFSKYNNSNNLSKSSKKSTCHCSGTCKATSEEEAKRIFDEILKTNSFLKLSAAEMIGITDLYNRRNVDGLHKCLLTLKEENDDKEKKESFENQCRHIVNDIIDDFSPILTGKALKHFENKYKSNDILFMRQLEGLYNNVKFAKNSGLICYIDVVNDTIICNSIPNTKKDIEENISDSLYEFDSKKPSDKKTSTSEKTTTEKPVTAKTSSKKKSTSKESNKIKLYKHYADYILVNVKVEEEARDILLSYSANMDEKCKKLYDYLIDLKKKDSCANFKIKLIKYLDEKTGVADIRFIENDD